MSANGNVLAAAVVTEVGSAQLASATARDEPASKSAVDAPVATATPRRNVKVVVQTNGKFSAPRVHRVHRAPAPAPALVVPAPAPVVPASALVVPAPATAPASEPKYMAVEAQFFSGSADPVTVTATTNTTNTPKPDPEPKCVDKCPHGATCKFLLGEKGKKGCRKQHTPNEIADVAAAAKPTAKTTATTGDKQRKKPAPSFIQPGDEVADSGSSQGAGAFPCGSCSDPLPFCESGPLCMYLAWGLCPLPHQETMCEYGPFCKRPKCRRTCFHQNLCVAGPDCRGLSSNMCQDFHQDLCDYGTSCWFKYAVDGHHKCNFFHRSNDKGALIRFCLFDDGYCPYASTSKGCLLPHRNHLTKNPMKFKEETYLNNLRDGNVPCREGNNCTAAISTCFFAHDGIPSTHIPPAVSAPAPAPAQNQEAPTQFMAPVPYNQKEKCRYCFELEYTGISCNPQQFDAKGRFRHRPANSA